MAQGRLPRVTVVATLVAAACRPSVAAPVQPSEPTAAERSTTVEDLRSDAVQPDAPTEDGGFLVELESLCRDPWKGVLVRAGDAQPSSRDPFEIRSATTYELRLLPGDAILLTTPHGGIMDVRFDGIADGYDARVEVNAECSGVKRTVVREPRR